MKTASKQSKETIKPATALPIITVYKGYIVTTNSDGSIPLNSRVFGEVSDGASTAMELICDRANAYPELVAALREVVAVERGWESIEALLRKLGEAS